MGLVIPDITNPFFPEVARGIEDQANEAGYIIFLCNTNWEEIREGRYLKLLTEKRVDGIIIAPTSNRVGFLEEVLPRGIPVVFVSRVANDSKTYNLRQSHAFEGKSHKSPIKTTLKRPLSKPPGDSGSCPGRWNTGRGTYVFRLSLAPDCSGVIGYERSLYFNEL